MKLLKSMAGLAFLVLVMIFAQANATEISAAPPDPPRPINGDSLVVGDVVSQGSIIGNGTCSLPYVDVRTTADPTKRKWMVIGVNAKCQAVVMGKWEGSLISGPKEVVGPLIKQLGKQSDTIHSVPAPVITGRSITPRFGVSSCKVYTDEIYMYGAGGILDGLTHVFVTLDFCYNGTTATANQITGYCAGDDIHLGWVWTVDSCRWVDSNVGPSTYVWGTLQGNFHCDPPGQFPCNQSNPTGYYHWIQNKLRGAYNGAVNCYYSYGGQIVSGVRKAQAC